MATPYKAISHGAPAKDVPTLAEEPGTPEVGDILAQARTRAPEMVTYALAELKSLARADGPSDTELRALVRANVELYLDTLDNEAVSPQAVAALCGARMPELRPVLRCCLVVQRAISELAREELGHIGQRGPSVLIRRLERRCERTTEAVVAAVADVRDSRHSERREVRRLQVARDLITGATDDSSGLDYPVEGAWHTALAAVGAGAEELLADVAAKLGLNHLCIGPFDDITWGWLGAHRRLPGADIERLLRRRRSQSGTLLTTGSEAYGMAGWRLSHQQALAALPVVRRSPAALTRSVDVAVEAAILASEPLIELVISRWLAPLDGLRMGGTTARETLEVWFAAEHRKSPAARRLKVDRDTLRRRLEEIELALGRPLGSCRAELEVALRLDRLGAAESAAETACAYGSSD